MTQSSLQHMTYYFIPVYSVLQPLSYLDIRKDLPTDVKACSSVLLHHCINSLPFGTGKFYLANMHYAVSSAWHPSNLDHSRAKVYCACSRWVGVVGHFFSHISFLFFLPLSEYRLKDCLKGLLSLK